MQEQAQGHVTMPALPAVAFTAAQAEQLLALPEAGLGGPTRTGQVRQAGQRDAAGGMAEEDSHRVGPELAAQHQPDV